MPYRSLLVHLDDSERCAARVALAARLARRWGSHLVGLSPTGSVPTTAYVGPGMLGVDMLTQAYAQLSRLAEERAARFRTACQAMQMPSFEAVVDQDDAAASLVRHSRCSDLVLLGQADPQAAHRTAAQALIEEVALHSARPTLVMPYAGTFDQVGDKVLVAWNDSRESARALADAMPLLRKAAQVWVMQCDTAASTDDAQLRARLEPLHRWLLWHGVEARMLFERTELDVGNALLSRAADLGADLLVMGAYGHWRWNERLLGGATRTVLSTMTLPVFMSH